MSRRKRRRGFTLLEVVLAMSALALVAGICYAAFHLAMRAVERGEVAVVTAQRLRVAADVLSRHMKSIIKYAAVDEDEEPYLYCLGTATSWTFITSVGQHGGGGLTKVVYQVRDDPPRLEMSESALFNSRTLGEEPVDAPTEGATVLLDGFTGFQFQYMGDPELGEGEGDDCDVGGWCRRWDCGEIESLPSAVRVLVDGLPGMESDGAGGTLQWGQEMPVMLAVFDPDSIEGDDELDELITGDPAADDEGAGDEETADDGDDDGGADEDDE